MMFRTNKCLRRLDSSRFSYNQLDAQFYLPSNTSKLDNTDHMLRLTEIKLPLDHPAPDLKRVLLEKLQIDETQLLAFTVYRRAVDARKSIIYLTYSVDVELADEDNVLARFELDPHVKRSPDMRYQFVATTEDFISQSKPQNKQAERPVVIGTGPCGLFAGLLLAQMGLCPIILERGKSVRERTKDTFGLWRKRELNPESNVQFG